MSENRRILSVVAAALLVCFIGPAAASADTTPRLPVVPSTEPVLAPSSHELAILRAVNSIRAAHGRRPLTLGPALHRAARAHSVDMVRRGYFDHGAWPAPLRRSRTRTRGEPRLRERARLQCRGRRPDVDDESSPPVGSARSELQQDRCRRGRWLDATRDSRLRRLARGYTASQVA